VGDLAKDSQKFAAAFVFSRERARERVSEFLSAIDISPLPILKRLSHSPKTKTKQKNTTVSGSTWDSSLVHPLSSFFSIQGPPTKTLFPTAPSFGHLSDPFFYPLVGY